MAVPAEWSAAIISELALRLLHRLNERVEVILGRDFLLGHALFWDVDVSSSEKAAETLAKAFDERVAATLRMTFLDQDEALAGVLNAGTPPATERPSVSGSGVAYWVVPAPELEAIAGPRLRIQDLTPLDGPSALKALHSLL
jgi:5-methylcytosine-specific restriction protein B